MFQEERNSPETMTPTLPAGPGGPHWRTLLEARWQALLREVTELSLAYHAAAATAPLGRDDAADAQNRRLLCRTIAVRRKLADVEDALDRLSAGTFGRCEQCHLPIPAGLLAVAPDRRYCPRCASEDPATEDSQAPGPALAGRSSQR
jgi:RNA polymerase-binding transcription factor